MDDISGRFASLDARETRTDELVHRARSLAASGVGHPQLKLALTRAVEDVLDAVWAHRWTDFERARADVRSLYGELTTEIEAGDPLG